MSVTTPLRISFGPAVRTSLAEGGDREWLVADGCGGYAMGTVCGLRTRRYHGRLVPAMGAPSARRLGLVALDPVLVLPSGVSVRLGVHEWSGGAVTPAGHTLLESFDLDDGLPRWRWRVGTSCWNASWRCATAVRRWRWCTGCLPAGRFAWCWRRW